MSVQPQALTGHPMLQRTIEALVSGQSARQISRWIMPPVSHAAISRYKARHVTPVLDNADQLRRLLRPHKEEKKEVNPLSHPETAITPPEPDVKKMAIKALVGAELLTIRDNRIKAQQDRHRRLAMVMDERAADMANVPGGASGLLCRDYKGEQEVYKLDGVLLAEFREHEKQIAIELGQWQENVQGAVSIQVICPADGGVPRIVYSAQDQIESSTIGLLQKP